MGDIRDFLRRYRVVLVSFMLIFILGRIAAPLAIISTIVSFIVLARQKNDIGIVFLMLAIFVISDNRLGVVQFFKPLRTVILLLVFFQTLQGLINGTYRFRPLFIVMILFFLTSLVGMMRNFDPFLSFSKSLSYLLLVFVALHYFNYVISKHRGQFLKDLISLIAVVLLIGLIFIVFYPGIAFFKGSIRYRGIFGNPNGIGVYTSIALPIMVLGYQTVKRDMSRWFWRILFGAFMASLVISYSRTALASSLLFLLLSAIHRRNLILVFLFYAFLIPFLLVVFSPQNLIWIIDQIGLSQELRVESILDGSGRFVAWQYALEEFRKYPLMGRGFAYEEILFREENVPFWIIASGHQGGAHNSYISFLLNNGIVGTFLILLFYGLFMKKIKPAYYIPVIIVSLGFSAFFEPWLNSSLNAFTVHFFILILLYRHRHLMTKPSLR